ncbi:beta-microseminoprotein-like [Dendropsophus ebraccatus]|uniref:beta-microseminoprotein-like n=1 Tax=Dendropsophus ebraccatus TaxID=150705 RepID=UPI003831CCBB
MKYLLVIALFGTGIFVDVCNAACFFTEPRKPGEPEGCDYDGEIHAYGSSWRPRECLSCNCYDDGSLTCCDVGASHVYYDEKECVAVFDKETCQYSVFRKDNPNEGCDFSAVG